MKISAYRVFHPSFGDKYKKEVFLNNPLRNIEEIYNIYLKLRKNKQDNDNKAITPDNINNLVKELFIFNGFESSVKNPKLKEFLPTEETLREKPQLFKILDDDNFKKYTSCGQVC